jgi:hypothetical protein
MISNIIAFFIGNPPLMKAIFIITPFIVMWLGFRKIKRVLKDE